MNQVNDGDSSIVSGGHNDSHRKRYQQVKTFVIPNFNYGVQNSIYIFQLAVFSATSRTDQMDAESDQVNLIRMIFLTRQLLQLLSFKLKDFLYVPFKPYKNQSFNDLSISEHS